MNATVSRSVRHSPSILAALVLGFFVGGCSSFNREWNKTATTPISINAIEGRWEGSWLSAVNGHHGRLRCLMTRIDDTRYRTRYKATYWKIFRIGYTVEMNVERQSDGSFKMQGQNDLGWWGGGLYHYDGAVDATNFSASYRSKYDHGTFKMNRPEHK